MVCPGPSWAVSTSPSSGLNSLLADLNSLLAWNPINCCRVMHLLQFTLLESAFLDHLRYLSSLRCVLAPRADRRAIL
jgi:hypothetical protein